MQNRFFLTFQKKQKYEKYMQRIKEITNGTHKHIQGTPVKIKKYLRIINCPGKSYFVEQRCLSQQSII